MRFRDGVTSALLILVLLLGGSLWDLRNYRYDALMLAYSVVVGNARFNRNTRRCF